MSRTPALILVPTVIAAATLLAIALTRPDNGQPGRPGRPTGSASVTASVGRTAPGPAQTTTPDGQAAGEADRLLPFTREQITQAVRLAERFTAAYTSHRAGESPRQYAQRLSAMTAPHLRPALEQTAHDAAVHARRRARHEVTAGQARADAIRTLGPSAIIFVVTATTRTTTHTPGGQSTRQEQTRYAVTTQRTTSGDGGGWSGGWVVYAIELASTGDPGDGGDRR